MVPLHGGDGVGGGGSGDRYDSASGGAAPGKFILTPGGNAIPIAGPSGSGNARAVRGGGGGFPGSGTSPYGTSPFGAGGGVFSASLPAGGFHSGSSTLAPASARGGVIRSNAMPAAPRPGGFLGAAAAAAAAAAGTTPGSYSSSVGTNGGGAAGFRPGSSFDGSDLTRYVEHLHMTDAQRQLVDDRRRRRRESHNAVERRRRDNINERIAELDLLIPFDAIDASQRGNKGMVLKRAVVYVRQLQAFIRNSAERTVLLEDTLQRVLKEQGLSLAEVGLPDDIFAGNTVYAADQALNVFTAPSPGSMSFDSSTQLSPTTHSTAPPDADGTPSPLQSGASVLAGRRRSHSGSGSSSSAQLPALSTFGAPLAAGPSSSAGAPSEVVLQALIQFANMNSGAKPGGGAPEVLQSLLSARLAAPGRPSGGVAPEKAAEPDAPPVLGASGPATQFRLDEDLFRAAATALSTRAGPSSQGAVAADQHFFSRMLGSGFLGGDGSLHDSMLASTPHVPGSPAPAASPGPSHSNGPAVSRPAAAPERSAGARLPSPVRFAARAEPGMMGYEGFGEFAAPESSATATTDSPSDEESGDPVPCDERSNDALADGVAPATRPLAPGRSDGSAARYLGDSMLLD